VRVSSEEALIAELPGKLMEALADEIAHCRREGRGEEATGPVAAGDATSSTPPEQSFGRPSNGLRQYLTFGILPWHLADLPAGAAETILREMLVQEWEAALHVLQTLGRRDPAPFFRLAPLLTSEQAQAVVRALVATGETGPVAPIEKAAAQLFPGLGQPLSSGTGQRLLALILAAACGAETMRAAARLLPAGELQVAQEFFRSPSGLPIALPSEWAMVQNPSGPQETGEGTAPSEAHPALPVPKRLGNPALEEDAAPRGVQAPEEIRPATGRKSTPGLYPLVVEQAGLVILHPFLPRFLAQTGCMEPRTDDRISTAMLPRAAALMYTLATGREVAREFELPLIKVLLGLSPLSPLTAGGDLVTASDREEAATLLAAVVSHWQALKNTSPAGLTESFLARRGLLREENDAFRLMVERKGHDVLLDYLPWGIGIVKLPWMKKAVHVEW